MRKTAAYLIMAFAAGALAASCSTTRRLTGDQVLYTGVNRINIEAQDGSRVPGAVRDAVREPLSVRPNNPLISPFIRTPLPIGLWAYNYFHTDKTRGFRAWVYRTLAKDPVLMEHVQPELRVEMVRDILDNHGYFGSQAAYELHPRRNPRKARVSYDVTVAPPWHYATVDYPPICCEVTEQIARMQATSSIRPGERYDIDSLTRERIRITNELRGESYYYFRPDYLQYKADTTRVGYGVDLRMRLDPAIPRAAMQPYDVGRAALRIYSSDGTGEADSLNYNGIDLWYQKPLKLRPKVIDRAFRFRPGDAARLDKINGTLDRLSYIGVFRYVNMEVTPLDSLRPGDPIDLTISAAMDTPMEAEVEVDLSYKSSSFLGPSLVLGFRHKNLFHGGEVFSVRFNGSYEWRTGNVGTVGNASAVNSYEFGVTTSLAFPRMIVPQFIVRAMSRGGRTTYQLGTNLLNRPRYFRMLSFDLSNTYDFRTSSTVTHSFTPFRMVYNNLLRTTAEFDDIMSRNRALAQGFQNQFIPSGSYTYTFDKRLGRGRADRFVWQVDLTTAGNLWAGVYRLFGVPSGQMKILGQPFSQFFRESTELKYFKRVARVNTVAMRLFVGVGHAYGNSSTLPYTEQFYVGGANSIRAFPIRSIGPGSFRPGSDNPYGFFDQSGEFRLEFNTEFRFRIAGGLNGAVFVDAGNVWLLKTDPERPGGRLGEEPFWRTVAAGTGFGLRYDLTFLVVRLDLGVAVHAPYDTGRAGYYNIPRFRDGLALHLAIGYPF